MYIKKEIRNIVARLLFLSGLTAPAWRSSNRFSVVTFHRVLPEAERQIYPLPGLAVTPEELDLLLSYFTKYFDCGTLAAQHERYLSNKAHDRPLLAITFDDAQYDNFKNARPLLAKHKAKASFFVPVKAVEEQELLWHDRLGFAITAILKQANSSKSRLMEILAEAGLCINDHTNLPKSVVHAVKPLSTVSRLRLVEDIVKTSANSHPPEFARLMTFKEIAELSADGHEIGSHSMTHCMMPKCDDHALSYEVSESRRTLQAALDQPIESFCYPNGDSDARTALAVAKAGYRRAVTTTGGSNDKNTNCFQLYRYDMNTKHMQDSNGRFLPDLLAFRMSGLYPARM